MTIVLYLVPVLGALQVGFQFLMDHSKPIDKGFRRWVGASGGDTDTEQRGWNP